MAIDNLENEGRGRLKVVGIKLMPGLPHGDFGKIVREPIEANVVLRQNFAVA